MKKQKGFTLVELIVVITIIAILWTIGFLSYGSYAASSRDSNRITNLRTIEKQLSLQYAKTWRYVPPENSVEIRSDSTVIRYQWEMWENPLAQLELWEVATWRDPLNDSFYTYATNANYNKYQLATFFEVISHHIPFISQTFAGYISNWSIQTIGKPIGIILDSNGIPVNENDTIITAWYLDAKNTTSTYSVYFSDEDYATGTGTTLAFEMPLRDKTISFMDANLLWFYDMSTFDSSWVRYITDLSVNANHATSGGSITYKEGYVVDTSPYSTGNRSAYIDTPISIEQSVWNYTYAAWVQVDTAYTPIIFSSADSYSMITARSYAQFDYSPWVMWATNNTFTPTKWQWFFYVLQTQNDGVTKLYLNGTVWTNTDIWTFKAGTFLFRFMNYRNNCYNCGSAGSVDAIDDVRIYDRILSDTEISKLYEIGRQ